MAYARKRSAAVYLAGYIGLLVSISLNFGLSFVDIGSADMGWILAVTAISEVILVLVFMHLLDHGPVAWLIALTAIVFLALLSSLMVLDVVARDYPGSHETRVRPP
jgi:cytochrome c oxidase subunit 4